MHLDFIHPDLSSNVSSALERQKESQDQHAVSCTFLVGDNVYLRNFDARSSDAWLPGVVSQLSGPRSVAVKLNDGRNVRCHFDHVKFRSVPSVPVRSPDFLKVDSSVTAIAVTPTTAYNINEKTCPSYNVHLYIYTK